MFGTGAGACFQWVAVTELPAPLISGLGVQIAIPFAFGHAHTVLRMKYYLWKSLLPLGLCLSIFFDGLTPPAFAQNVPARIDIVIVEGEGVTSNIRQTVSRDPVVRIEDDDHRPIGGVAVVFALPVSGTSGEFSNGSKTLTIVTDNGGLAAAHGLKVNDVPGKLQIYVTAPITAYVPTLINQAVEARQTSSSRLGNSKVQSSGTWKWVVLGIVAAGGAGAAFALKGRGNSALPALRRFHQHGHNPSWCSITCLGS